jgi:hypothetical protein
MWEWWAEAVEELVFISTCWREGTVGAVNESL